MRAGSYGVELLDYEGVSYGLYVDVGIDVYDYGPSPGVSSKLLDPGSSVVVPARILDSANFICTCALALQFLSF